jgi:hypothetical protein
MQLPGIFTPAADMPGSRITEETSAATLATTMGATLAATTQR